VLEGGATEAGRRGTASRSQILDNAMAHKVAYLLLPSLGHSRTGIMRGDWNRNDMQCISMQGLFFTPQQAGLIRADVGARMGRHEVAQISALAR